MIMIGKTLNLNDLWEMRLLLTKDNYLKNCSYLNDRRFDSDSEEYWVDIMYIFVSWVTVLQKKMFQFQFLSKIHKCTYLSDIKNWLRRPTGTTRAKKYTSEEYVIPLAAKICYFELLKERLYNDYIPGMFVPENIQLRIRDHLIPFLVGYKSNKTIRNESPRSMKT